MVNIENKDKNSHINPGDIIARVDKKYFRPSEVDSLIGDASKAKNKLGWAPTISIEEMCNEMMKEDMKLAQKLRDNKK